MSHDSYPPSSPLNNFEDNPETNPENKLAEIFPNSTRILIGVTVIILIVVFGTLYTLSKEEPGTTSIGSPLPTSSTNTYVSSTRSPSPEVTKPKATATSQTQTPRPINTPSPSGWPNANNTGVPAGVVLTPSVALTVTKPNSIISGLDISGSVSIQASGVTIKNCKIHGTGNGGITVRSGDVTILDSEIFGFSNYAISFDNWKAYRVNIHSVADDGVKFGTNTLLQDSYLHDFTPSADAHADGGQMQSGESNIVIRHNTINIPQGNSALFFAPDLGPSSLGPVLIDGNLLGGGNFTLFIVDGNNGQYHQSGYTVTNNRFLRTANYGPVNINEPKANFIVWSGNVYDNNGEAILL
jgi:hypothetical protein